MIKILKNWQKWKKVYSISADLYDDFMANFKDGKDIEVPLSVLSNIPFDIFYLNLRDKNIRRASAQGKRNVLDGMFIKLLRDGDRILGFALVMNEVMDGDYVTGTILIDLDMFDKDEHDIILFSFERMQEILAKGRFGFDVGKYGGDRKATEEDEAAAITALEEAVKAVGGDYASWSCPTAEDYANIEEALEAITDNSLITKIGDFYLLELDWIKK